jgi:hypothetical protein
MKLRERIRDWVQPIYFLGQNPITLTGAVITTSTALTTIAFWFYDIFLPGPPHPYIGLLVFLILPGIFVLGLLLIPLGIWLKRRSLLGTGQLPQIYPAINLQLPVVRRTLEWVVVATALNLLIVGTASYRGVEYMDSVSFCGTTCHRVMALSIRPIKILRTRGWLVSSATSDLERAGLSDQSSPACVRSTR